MLRSRAQDAIATSQAAGVQKSKPVGSAPGWSQWKSEPQIKLPATPTDDGTSRPTAKVVPPSVKHHPSILIAQTAGTVSKEREKHKKKSAWSRVEKLKALMFSSNKPKSNPVENMTSHVCREKDESEVKSTAGQLSSKSRSLPDDLPHVSAWFSKRSPVAQDKQAQIIRETLLHNVSAEAGKVNDKQVAAEQDLEGRSGVRLQQQRGEMPGREYDGLLLIRDNVSLINFEGAMPEPEGCSFSGTGGSVFPETLREPAVGEHSGIDASHEFGSKPSFGGTPVRTPLFAQTDSNGLAKQDTSLSLSRTSSTASLNSSSKSRSPIPTTPLQLPCTAPVYLSSASAASAAAARTAMATPRESSRQLATRQLATRHPHEHVADSIGCCRSNGARETGAYDLGAARESGGKDLREQALVQDPVNRDAYARGKAAGFEEEPPTQVKGRGSGVSFLVECPWTDVEPPEPRLTPSQYYDLAPQEPCEKPHALLHPSRTPQHTHTHTTHTHCHTHASITPQHLSMTHQHPSLGLLDHSPELFVHEPQRIFGAMLEMQEERELVACKQEQREREHRLPVDRTQQSLWPQSHERNAQQNAATSTSWLPCGGTGRLPCDSSPRWTSCNLPPSFSPPSFSPPIRSIDLSPPLASPYLNASDLACPRQYRLSGQCRSALPSSAHLGILAGSETVLPCDSQSFSSPAPVSFSSPVVTITHLPPSFSPPIRSCTRHSDRSEAPASPGDASFFSISCDPLGSLFGGSLSDRRSPGSSQHGQGRWNVNGGQLGQLGQLAGSLPESRQPTRIL